MATIRIVLGIVCLAFINRCNHPVGNFVTDLGEKYLNLQITRSLPRGQQTFPLMEKYAKDQSRNEAFLHKPKAWPAVPSHPALVDSVRCRFGWCNLRWNKEQGMKIQEQRAKIIAIALTQVGVREQTGQNDGDAVTSYLAYVKLKKGSPWCAAFVSWVFGKAGFTLPKTGWSPALFPLNKQTLKVQPATVFGIYFPLQKRIAHVGFVQQVRGSYIVTLEGNTNNKESREGDGVYRKRRHLKTVKVYADWLGK